MKHLALVVLVFGLFVGCGCGYLFAQATATGTIQGTSTKKITRLLAMRITCRAPPIAAATRQPHHHSRQSSGPRRMEPRGARCLRTVS